MGKYRTLLSVAISLLLLVFSAAEAVDLRGEGYDENTEVTVKGAVVETLRGIRGPVTLRLIHQDRAYRIVTAPPWYLRREGIVFPQGSEIEVTGSKYFGEDGNIYVIARKIRETKTGKEFFFRDAFCRPVWHGMRNR